MVLSVQPDEGVSLRLIAKVPGQTMTVRPVLMEFKYGTSFLGDSPEAYERLLHDALLGDATLFTRADEVEAEWRLIDPILEAWASEPAPPLYEAGTQGPPQADELLAVAAAGGGRFDGRNAPSRGLESAWARRRCRPDRGRSCDRLHRAHQRQEGMPSRAPST